MHRDKEEPLHITVKDCPTRAPFFCPRVNMSSKDKTTKIPGRHQNSESFNKKQIVAQMVILHIILLTFSAVYILLGGIPCKLKIWWFGGYITL